MIRGSAKASESVRSRSGTIPLHVTLQSTTRDILFSPLILAGVIVFERLMDFRAHYPQIWSCTKPSISLILSVGCDAAQSRIRLSGNLNRRLTAIEGSLSLAEPKIQHGITKHCGRCLFPLPFQPIKITK